MINLILQCIAFLFFFCTPITNASLNPAASAAAKSIIRKNVISGAAIFTAGDAAAQLYTSTSSTDNNIDTGRLASSSCIGAIWSGLVIPNLYATAESVLPGRSKSRILGKMLITCGILSTGGNYITMLSRRMIQLMRNIEGGPTSFEDCLQSCNRDIGHVIKDDMKIWPAYDIMCFSLIPPRLRTFTTAIMSSSWAMYISIVSDKDCSTI